ncbi:hypothetical protein BDF22DRAFT_661829 [Syncephalis plumigaleata]|nr:hypothetical protein BDF22DRAFT_661829 [Syncephalis plumigaleata]
MNDEESRLSSQPLLPTTARSSIASSSMGRPSNATTSSHSNSSSNPMASSTRSTDEILSVPISLRVRFSDGTADLPLELPSRALISTIREKIYQERINLSGKYLRLIHHGRELPETKRVGELVPPNGPTDIWIHCAPSDHPSVHRPLDGSNNDPTQNTTSRIIGFDRLRSTGFSEEEINALREQFHQWRGTNMADEPVNDEENLQAQREEEEAWIEDNTVTLPDGSK